MTAQVHQYAVAHGYCTAVGSTGAATPDSRGVAYGACGDSWIQIDNLGHGNARFTWGFDSTAGAVAYRGLAVSYLNELFGNYGGWNDGSVMLSSSYSSKPRTNRPSGAAGSDPKRTLTSSTTPACRSASLKSRGLSKGVKTALLCKRSTKRAWAFCTSPISR